MCGRCKKLKRLITKTLCRICRDHIRAWHKRTYDAEAERQRDGGYGKRMAAWRASHPEQNRTNKRAANRRRRAMIARVLATLTPAEWDAILQAAGHACIYCGSTKQLTQDHLIPLSRGGPHTAENVAPACWPCNASKHNKTTIEFLTEAA